jgi:hypothetical protein
LALASEPAPAAAPEPAGMHYRPLALVYPVNRDACRIGKRDVAVFCNEEDLCEITDVIEPRPGFPCSGDWGFENPRADGLEAPVLKLDIGPWARGQAAQPGPCDMPDHGVGWCFREVPAATRLHFTIRARAQGRGSGILHPPGMAVRHHLLSRQTDDLVARKGLVLGLTPEAWKVQAVTSVRARGVLVSAMEMTARSLVRRPADADRPEMAKADPWDTRASVESRPGRKVELEVPEGVRFVDIGYERIVERGFGGPAVELGLERAGGQWQGAGSLGAEVWFGAWLGAALRIEGSSAGRFGIGIEALGLTHPSCRSAFCGLPSLGLGFAVSEDILPEPRTWTGAKLIVQQRWVGLFGSWAMALVGGHGQRWQGGLSLSL